MATGKLLTDLRELDELAGGFKAGELVVIAGRPSTGKTSLVAAIAAGVALRQSRFVFVASPEMSAAAMVRRISASREGIRVGAVSRMNDSLDLRAPSHVHVDDDQSLAADDLAARVRTATSGRALRAVVVDPVWYLAGLGGRSGIDASRHTAAAVRSLRATSSRLGVPVIATIGLRRHAGTRPPRLSDVPADRAIRTEASTVLLLHAAKPGPQSLTVTLAHHPAGRRGTARLSLAS